MEGLYLIEADVIRLEVIELPVAARLGGTNEVGSHDDVSVTPRGFYSKSRALYTCCEHFSFYMPTFAPCRYLLT
jgi:hypothetical protein